MDTQNINQFFDNPESFLETWKTLHSKLAYIIKCRKANVKKLQWRVNSVSFFTNRQANQTRSYLTVLNEIHRLVVATTQSLQVINRPEKCHEFSELAQILAKFRYEIPSRGLQSCVQQYGPKLKALTDALMLGNLYQKCQVMDLIDTTDQAIFKACGLFNDRDSQDISSVVSVSPVVKDLTLSR
jgi:hypothetical protein